MGKINGKVIWIGHRTATQYIARSSMLKAADLNHSDDDSAFSNLEGVILGENNGNGLVSGLAVATSQVATLKMDRF